MENGQKTMLFFTEEMTSMKTHLFTKLIVCLDIFWTLEPVISGFLFKKIMLYRVNQAYCIA